MKSMALLSTCLGELVILESEGYIVNIAFGPKILSTDIVLQKNQALSSAVQQLKEYFAGTRKVFDLPLQAEGSDFQKKVWSALQAIPYGKTVSYKDIGISIGHAKAFRAVGAANNKNPLLIVIPCHRVLGAKGALVGYAAGLGVKEKLLALERAHTACKRKQGINIL